jgi:hypothetical protein
VIFSSEKRGENLEKADAINRIYQIIGEYEKVNGQDSALQVLSEILKDYDLSTAANLVKSNCEPDVCKWAFEDGHYDEGNEEAGFIDLKSILSDYEKILNCDDSMPDIHFRKFIRLETMKKRKKRGIVWMWIGSLRMKN